MSVSGVKTPWTSRSNMSFFFGVNNNCVHDSGNNIASGSIAYSRIPTTIKSRGSDNYHYTLTFALTPDHSIPLGGHLQFTLGTDWH